MILMIRVHQNRKIILLSKKKSNRLSLIAIKKSVSAHLLSDLSETNSAKKLFDAIG